MPVFAESAAPTIVDIREVTKRFVLRKDNSLKERIVTFGRAGRRHREDYWALAGVTATIPAGQTVALIGHNGSGKSTLLKVIGGVLDATSGSVARRGRVAALLELGAGFHPDLTGRENVYLNAAILGLTREQTDDRFDAILEFSGIGEFIDTQVKFYSSGMYVRLAFAVAVHTDPDLLLVDEVLAVGDEAFQRKCLDKIRSFQHEGRTIVLVTHSLGQVEELCDRAILLNAGAVVFDGEPREAVSRFRDILEARRVSAIERSESARSGGVAPVTHEALIRSVQAAARGRTQDDDVQLGDNLEITLDVELLVDIEDIVCAIQIDNTMGQAVYGTTSKRLDVAVADFRGRRRLRFVLERCMFGHGKYFINASVLDQVGRHIVDFPQATSFNSAGTQLSVGPAFAEPTFVDLGAVE